MIGLLYSLFGLAAVGIDSINQSIDNYKNKTRAIQNGDLTYYGARGNEYLVENDKWVHRKINDSGEEVIVDMKTGQVYYNLTKRKIEKLKEEQVKQGRTVRMCAHNEKRGYTYGQYKQSYQYIDIESDIPVHEVFINGRYFYQELLQGFLLRIADNEAYKEKIGGYTDEEIITMFNNRQKEMKWALRNLGDDSFWLKENYFFDKNHYVYFDKEKEMKIFWVGTSDAMQRMWKYIKEDLKEGK